MIFKSSQSPAPPHVSSHSYDTTHTTLRLCVQKEENEETKIACWFLSLDIAPYFKFMNLIGQKVY